IESKNGVYSQEEYITIMNYVQNNCQKLQLAKLMAIFFYLEN
ncbi:35666_t:CDS:1, partial [Racocetra persica]